MAARPTPVAPAHEPGLVPSITGARSTRSVAGRIFGVVLIALGSLALANDRVRANTSQIPSAPAIGSLVSLGYAHACYIVDGGSVKCWGLNTSGQAGNGTVTNVARGTETVVAGITDAVALSTSVFQTCALLASGSIRCWGAQNSGALGNGVGTFTNATTPVTVSGINDAVEVELRSGGGCALTETATVWCWGNNAKGAVGDGTTTDRLTPVSVSGLTHPIRLSSGMSSVVSCAVTEGATSAHADNELWCWGSNQYGQLTDGTMDITSGAGAYYESPRQIRLDPTTPLTGVVSAVTGDTSTCALMHDGTVWCWGQALGGRLGDGRAGVLANSSAYPVQVKSGGATPLTEAISVSAAQGGFCAATVSAGTRGQRCWGARSTGEALYATFVPNVSVSAVAHLMAGQHVAAFSGLGLDWCAVMEDHSLVCGSGSNAPIVVATGLSGPQVAPPPPPSSPSEPVLPPNLAPLVTTPVMTIAPSTAPPLTTAPGTSVPATTTTAPSTTPAPVPSPSGVLPDLANGETLLTVDGTPAEVELVIEDESLVMRRSDFELRLSGACDEGCSISEDANGRATITLVRDGQANVSGFGFLPGSLVHLWIFSEPAYLGALEVQADGTYAGSFPLADIGPGVHTLQANGVSADNVPRSASLGIVVTDVDAPDPDVVALPATGLDATPRALALMALVLLSLGAVVVSRRTSATRT